MISGLHSVVALSRSSLELDVESMIRNKETMLFLESDAEQRALATARIRLTPRY